MAHVELSLSQAFVPQPRTPSPPEPVDSFNIWIATVSSAAEPCLVIDHDTAIAAASVTCCDLLGLGNQADAVGRPLLDGTLRLVDFTAARVELADSEFDKIPPLLALTSGRLARGLLRVQGGAGEADQAGEAIATVDAVATPLLVDGAVAGSLTFFSQV